MANKNTNVIYILKYSHESIYIYHYMEKHAQKSAYVQRFV